MDQAKKAAFVARGRRHFAGGGVVKKLKRKRFADGGTTLGGPTANGTSDSSTNPNSGLLGTINQGLGLNNNFVAQAAAIQPGTNAAQLNQAYTQAQGGLGMQQGLANTLTPQVSSAVNNQNALADQYLAMSKGQGPNPALDQLAQSTGQNTANQAALAAGQRGASGNVGLMARQNAQQGAATQQQSAGQAATLGAQQQIAAQGNLANLANNQVSQAGQATTGYNSAAQNEQSILQNANTSANNAAVGMQSNINNNNAQTSAANQNMAANTLGGIASAASSGSSMFSMSKGGEVGAPEHLKLAEMNAHSLKHAKRYDDGGEVDAPNLGSFKASDDSASSPNVAASGSLPADQTNLASSVQKPSSGGGGGGGMSSLMGLAAMAAGGGEIVANPLIGGGHMESPGAASWGGTYTGSSASGGPNIGGGTSLPGGSTKFSDVVSKAMAKKPGDEHSADQTQDQAEEGYLDADAKLGSSGIDNREEMGQADNTSDAQGNVTLAQGGSVNHFHDYFSDGGKVPAMVSPGEIYLSPDKVRRVVSEGIDPAKIGEKFKGKAKVKGDSLKNDTIPKDLEEGGVVIDRKNMSTREKRELFVHRSIAKHKAGGK